MDGRGDQQRKRLAGCAALLNKHRKQQALEQKDAVLESQVFKDNPKRYDHQLQFVKSFIVHAPCPFSIAEHLRIRRCLSLLCSSKLQVDGLHSRAVSVGVITYILCLFSNTSYTLDNTLPGIKYHTW